MKCHLEQAIVNMFGISKNTAFEGKHSWDTQGFKF